MGVGGQFSSRKEKQISGIRGLVLRRPAQGAASASTGDEDWGNSLAGRALSSVLSSGCQTKTQANAIDYHAIFFFFSPKIQPMAGATI